MSDLTACDQNNWLASANLVIQLAFLSGGLWFARNLLRTMMAFQEPVGAMLRLSITGVTAERHSSSASAKQSLAEVSPYWLAPPANDTVAAPYPLRTGPSQVRGPSRSVVALLQRLIP